MHAETIFLEYFDFGWCRFRFVYIYVHCNGLRLNLWVKVGWNLSHSCSSKMRILVNEFGRCLVLILSTGSTEMRSRHQTLPTVEAKVVEDRRRVSCHLDVGLLHIKFNLLKI